MIGQRTLLLGATGLIGSFCLTRLLEEEEVKQIVVLSRQPLERTHVKLDKHVIRFDRLAEYAALFEVDSLFCCLGTTLKAAGSRDAFEKVDYGYVKQAAELAAAQKVRQFLLISAFGANPRSPLFYSRTKGRAEQAVRQLPLQCTHIIRPSMLMGTRPQPRLNEELLKPLAKIAMPLLVGPMRHLRPVQAEEVANMMVDLAKCTFTGVNIHYPTDLCGQGG
ncbi:MAG: NAD(P)H-binding protein [Gammaproteobacteria bacterium]|nr:NAD(P)H-binding protein [Gammaproteobacteria bacterium]